MLRFRLWYWLLWLGALGGCQLPEPVHRITAANYLTAIPDPKTLGEAYVSDPDSILAPGTAPALNAQLDSLDRSGRAHLDVVLVRSLGAAVPKTAATALFNKWKVGGKTTNNGLLMLLVLDQRRVEFETGYGLEADLPDIICYRIQQRYMLDAARASNYDQAVQQGVAAIIRRLRPAPAPPKPVLATADDSARYYADSLQRALMAQSGYANATDDPLEQALPGEASADNYYPPEPGPPVGLLAVAALALVLYLVLWYRTTQQLRGRGWLVLVPLGLVGGLVGLVLQGKLGPEAFLALLYGLPLLYLHGYFGWHYWQARRPVAPLGRPEAYGQQQAAHRGLAFTAYLFPVGLALYWRWYGRHLAALRDAPFACPDCGLPMHKLDSAAEKTHLAPGQQVEEASRAVEHEVWKCAQGHHLWLAYPNPETKTQVCPACHHRTLAPPRLRVVQAATTSAEGWGWRVATCRFCQHEVQEREVISRLPSPVSSSSSSSSGSSSWGSSSGSSYSSRSTSSGGSSGGGGAGSTW
ncbi:TPM domain-containing protein [Hymenobacter setariae]|uniref:TPM domain-containing protein n=1 Tax=Hymenobacter setariae TaxID=2594794 RepID=A0A558C220_9BACT|nr:TPM domain-containing protein [Hymenobacter setariae]TVT42819.1 TPM domain-containing protein [Hymenobacter setariae]